MTNVAMPTVMNGRFADIHDHGRDVEVVDEHDPRQHVQRRVEEREQPEHPPQLDEVVPAGEAAQRRDRERDREEGDRPGAGLVGDVVARVGGERVQVAEDERCVETLASAAAGMSAAAKQQNFDDRDRLQ